MKRIRDVVEKFRLLSRGSNRKDGEVKFTFEGRKFDLIIFDDFFPGRMSNFRNFEFAQYGEYFNVKIISELNHYGRGGILEEGTVEEDLAYLKATYSGIERSQFQRLSGNVDVNAKCHYFVFYMNVAKWFDLLEKYKTPFVFTLYPGGGFWVYNKKVLNNLKKVCASDHCKGIIVTQSTTLSWMLENDVCDYRKLVPIYGCPIPWIDEKHPNRNYRDYYPQARGEINICFVAASYTVAGVDKGFDVFCKTAKELSEKYNYIRFHVVGGFSEEDEALVHNKAILKFHGVLDPDQLSRFYDDMDVIVSPNRAFSVNHGKFDGFPTASVVEAGLKGVCILSTDPLDNRIYAGLEEDRHFILISDRVTDVTQRIEELLGGHGRIAEIGIMGQKIMKDLFSYKVQINPRVELIKRIINDSSN